MKALRSTGLARKFEKVRVAQKPRGAAVGVRLLVVPLFALFLLTEAAGAVFVKLPNPVSLQEESMNRLRKASALDADQWKLVVFGFSHCSDICPRSLKNMASLVGVASEQEIRLDGVFVTVDPDRDTDKILAAHTAPLGKGTSYLRLEGEALERFKDEFGVEAVFYTKNRGNAFHYQVDHSSTAFLIDPSGKIRVVFDALEDVEPAAEMFRQQGGFFQ